MQSLACSSLDDSIVPMYIRKDSHRHKDRVYTNYRLVEAYHTPDGPRQRTVCSLGDLMRQVVNRLYTFQAKAHDLHFVAMMDRAWRRR